MTSRASHRRAILSVALLLRLAPSVLAQSAAPSRPALAVEIERILEQAFKNDPPEMAERVRQIFKDYGAPTIEMVGADAAEDFVVAASHDQPIAFMGQVLGAIDRAAPQSVPPNAAAFLRARLRQKGIENAVPAAVAQPDLRDRIARLIADDQGVRTEHADDPTRWSEVDKRTGVESARSSPSTASRPHRWWGPKRPATSSCSSSISGPT